MNMSLTEEATEVILGPESGTSKASLLVEAATPGASMTDSNTSGTEAPPTRNKQFVSFYTNKTKYNNIHSTIFICFHFSIHYQLEALSHMYVYS